MVRAARCSSHRANELITAPTRSAQLIFSVLKTLQDQELTVELKNDMAIRGQLKSVDQCVKPPLAVASRDSKRD